MLHRLKLDADADLHTPRRTEAVRGSLKVTVLLARGRLRVVVVDPGEPAGKTAVGIGIRGVIDEIQDVGEGNHHQPFAEPPQPDGPTVPAGVFFINKV